MLKKLKNWFSNRKNNNNLDKITINKSTLNKIMEFASSSYPYEFVAFFEGKINKNVLSVDDIIFQPYKADTHSARPRIEIPLTTKTIGSIHSHPGPRNTPSRADLHFFQKTGIIHGIICYPYNIEDFELYDFKGNPIVFEIV